MPMLLWLFIIPFIAAAIVLVAGGLSRRNLKWLSFIMSLVPLIMLCINHKELHGAHINFAWFPGLSINFHLAIDGISLVFLYLTAIIIPVSILAVRSSTQTFSSTFYALVFILEGLLIGFFSAKDLALFTIFWEAMLLPLYFIINLWGGPLRQSAAIKFLVYMIAGSTLMIAAVLALYFFGSSTHTFDMDTLAKSAVNAPYAKWIFAAFLLAFAVKTPLFPFHAWLPDAYYQASTAGTILLAAILSKAGIYGIARIGLGFFPSLIEAWSPYLIALGIIGVLYGGMAAWMQNDFKRLIAYSSFSHVNFILVGLFVANEVAHTGAVLQAFNHGIIIAALFLVASWLAERTGSTIIGKPGGVAAYLPKLCWLTLFFILASVALPGTNGFVGEILILYGLFAEHPWQTTILGLSIILSVIYMLRWMQYSYFGPADPKAQGIDIKAKHLFIALPLILLILWVGIYPAPLIKQIEPASAQLAPVAVNEESR